MDIAVLGCGTVACGLARLLKENSAVAAGACGEKINIKRILARTPSKAYALGFTDLEITQNMSDILGDDDIKVVVELMGGTGAAFDYIKAALGAHKHVVTANKDLIELRWRELHELAAANGVELVFEASVAGAIPIIGPLRETLSANRFSRIFGILNGTTNYILTRMAAEGCSYETALADAQRLGYAESDPSADVEGVDAARKIAILARIAFGAEVPLEKVYREGITELDDTDAALASRLGYAIKLVAGASANEGGVSVFVRPAFVPLAHPLASVDGVFNAVFLSSDFAGDLMFYGRGAGSKPTASSVAGDIIDIARNINSASHCPRVRLAERGRCEALPSDELVSGFCVRMRVDDRPLVLAGVASAFGERGVSLRSIVQDPCEGGANLVLITHPCREGELQSALGELKCRDYVRSLKTIMCLEPVKGEIV